MRIALIAHDNKKLEMVALAKEFADTLQHFSLCATGTTGQRIMDATQLKITCYRSGPLGGDQQIGSAIVNREIDVVIFLRDPLTAHPHEPDVSALLRVCDVTGTPVATNLQTAHYILNQLRAEQWNTVADRPVGTQLGWQQHRTRYLFRSTRFHLREDIVTPPRSETNLTWTFLEHPGAVFIVPVTSDGKIILIRMYRYTTDDWTWETPAGGLGDKEGVAPIDVAKIELKEETGGEASALIDLGWHYCSNGIANKRIHYFLAHDTKIVAAPACEIGEHIEPPQMFTIEEVEEMMRTQVIRDGETMLALHLALIHLNLHKKHT